MMCFLYGTSEVTHPARIPSADSVCACLCVCACVCAGVRVCVCVCVLCACVCVCACVCRCVCHGVCVPVNKALPYNDDLASPRSVISRGSRTPAAVDAMWHDVKSLVANEMAKVNEK